MQTGNPTNQQSPTLHELKALRREFSAMREEVAGLRSDLNSRKTINITDQVAKGVAIAGLFWIVLISFLQILF